MYNIKFINHNDSDFSKVKMIRTAVFTREQGADADGEFDCYDDGAVLLCYMTETKQLPPQE